MLRWLILPAFLFLSASLLAQYISAPLESSHNLLIESWRMKNPESGFDNAKRSALIPIETLDSIRFHTPGWSRKRYRSWVMRKLKNEHLIQIRKKDFYLNGNFAIDLRAGRDQNDPNKGLLYNNTRGYSFEGTVGRRVFFRTTLFENQGIYPAYMDSLIRERGSIPGAGKTKRFDDFTGNKAYDYAFATGVAGVAFNQYSYISGGYDQQFIGSGYRSVLLSDVSTPYPFVSGNLGFFKGKLQYSTTWAMLQTSDRIPLSAGAQRESPYERKAFKYSYLSLHPKHWLEVGLYSAVIEPYWSDSGDYTIDGHYYQPSSELSFLMGDKQNVQIMGVNAEVNAFKFLKLYGQYAQSRGAEGALQIGALLLDPMKWNFICLRIEYNRDAINALSSDTSDLISNERRYSNSGQLLGFPIGSARTQYEEVVVQGTIRIRDFILSGSIQSIGFQPFVSNRFAGNYLYSNAEVIYQINPMSNGEIALGATYRTASHPGELNTQFVYFAFRTRLINRYFDF